MAHMITSKDIRFLTNSINDKKVVCFKTDTIWGLSANPTCPESISKLYKIKDRNLDKPFVFLLSNKDDINKYVCPLNNLEKLLIKNFWPGALTIIFKAKSNLPILQNYKQKTTIAIRMPKDETCQKILNELTYPLPSTSVNKAGETQINDYNSLKQFLKNEDIVLLECEDKNNNTILEKSSTIVSAMDGKLTVLREGNITKDQILNLIK